MSVNLTTYKVVPTSSPIDYKKVTPDDYMFGRFERGLSMVKLIPDEQGYIVTDLLNKIDYEKTETCIVNVGVGQGKTTAAYHIIDHYATKDDYVVILISPLKKLVKRDYDILKEKGLYKVAHYWMAKSKSESFESLLDSKVHIITINTFLQNPGEDNLEMSYASRKYIKGIRNYCEDKGKKVVFVFDEIHAGLHTFQQKYIFNLLVWKKYTHKCFVLSATFTEAAMVATEYIGRLTDLNYKIYETPRQKMNFQADLHLYVTEKDYSFRNFNLLSPLIGIIEKEAKDGNRVHIITAYKELAYKITDPNSKLLIAKTINKHLDYLILTADEDNEFDKRKSNIGTTFSTGVNIDLGKDALVLIMPSGKSQSEPTGRKGGIFTDGTVSITQAVARLRGKGSIYIFLPYDENLIKPTYTAPKGNEDVFLQTKFSGTKERRSYEVQVEELAKFYRAMREDFETEIDVTIKENKERDEDGLLAMQASLNYPDLKQFMLEDGDAYLTSQFESFGRNFSPYVLWAAWNDQFINATLKEVHWVEEKVEKLELEKAKIIPSLLSHFGGLERVKELVAGKTFDKAFNVLLDELLSQKKEEDEVLKVQLRFNDKTLTDKSKFPMDVQKAIVVILLEVLDESIKPDLKDEFYLLDKMAGALKKANKGQVLGTLEKEYHTLCQIKVQMSKHVAENLGKVTVDFITDERLKSLFKVAIRLKEEDLFIKRKIFRFIDLKTKDVLIAKDFIANKTITLKAKEAFRGMFFRELSNTFFKNQFKGKGVKKIGAERPLPKESFFTRTFPNTAPIKNLSNKG